MPLFDYTCQSCKKTSELLVRGDSTPSCPECGSTDMVKEMSMFSVGPPVPTAAQKEQARIERAGWVRVGKPFKNRR